MVWARSHYLKLEAEVGACLAKAGKLKSAGALGPCSTVERLRLQQWMPSPEWDASSDSPRVSNRSSGRMGLSFTLNWLWGFRSSKG